MNLFYLAAGIIIGICCASLFFHARIAQAEANFEEAMNGWEKAINLNKSCLDDMGKLIAELKPATPPDDRAS
jgi:MFS superfamily sulfate permease-like transporter